MLILNNIKQLNDFIKLTGITRPENIAKLLADKKVIVSPDVAKVILKAA